MRADGLRAEPGIVSDRENLSGLSGFVKNVYKDHSAQRASLVAARKNALEIGQNIN